MWILVALWRRLNERLSVQPLIISDSYLRVTCLYKEKRNRNVYPSRVESLKLFMKGVPYPSAFSQVKALEHSVQLSCLQPFQPGVSLSGNVRM